MPIFEVTMESLDSKTQEDIELTGSKLNDFTTIRQPDMNQLKHKFEHTKDTRFYLNPGRLYLGDKTYCKICTEEIFKGNPGDSVVEGSAFGWIRVYTYRGLSWRKKRKVFVCRTCPSCFTLVEAFLNVFF